MYIIFFFYVYNLKRITMYVTKTKDQCLRNIGDTSEDMEMN